MEGDNGVRRKNPSASMSRPVSPLDTFSSIRNETRKQIETRDHAISSSDEGETATGWTTATRKKPQTKRPRTSTDATPGLEPMHPPITTRNPFTVLPVEEASPSRQTSPPPPPPVFIENVCNYGTLREDLNNLIGTANYMTKPTATGLKINTTTGDAYRSLQHYLTQKKAQYHTYQNPQDKTLRVVIRHLHYTTPTTMITDELTSLGFSIRQVNNVLQRQTKRPLHLFFVDLDMTDKNKSIFGLTSLLNCKITVEEPYRRHEIPQCHRCQSFHHTQAYCHHNPRCVRCGEDHQSSQCKKGREVPPTCALCKGRHPANYKGCTIYQELQKKRRTSTTTPTTTLQPARSNISSPATSSSQARTSNTHLIPLPATTTPANIPAPVNSISPSHKNVNSYFSPSCHSVTASNPPQPLPRKMTYAQATLPRQSQPDIPLPSQPQDNLINQLNNFLNYLKNILTLIIIS